MKKPNRCLITVTIITVLLSVFVLITLWPNWKKNYDKKLEYMYERQSVAFGMGRENSYKDWGPMFDEARLLLCITAYNEEMSTNYTLEEMKTAFKDGDSDLWSYARWFNNGGDSAGLDLYLEIIEEIGEDGFAKMTIEELENHLNER